MPATVSMPLEELDALKDQIKERDKRIGKLKAELIQLKITNSPIDYLKLCEAVRATIPILGYAVANLHPEFSKKWPFDNLKTFAKLLNNLPDFNPYDLEFAVELEKFAFECEAWETKRKQQGERYIPEPQGVRTPVEVIMAMKAAITTPTKAQADSDIDDIAEASEGL